jgi:NAD(P)-dependent dehydrogenase (short-subunit alcohol dehydrogenase family)
MKLTEHCPGDQGGGALVRAQAAMAGTVPQERMGTSDDLGKPALFIASDDSSYVDGGAAQY